MTEQSPTTEDNGLDAFFIALFNRSKLLCFSLVFFISLGFIQALNDLTDWFFTGNAPADVMFTYGFSLLIAASGLRAAKAAIDKQNGGKKNN